MSELIPINVIIANRPYPLKIKAEEEEIIRQAVKQINEKIREWEHLYSAKDKQDFLTMIALTTMVENVSLKNQLQESEALLAQQLEHIVRLLDNVQ